MTYGRPGRRAYFVILTRLGLTREQFQALSWVDQRMYIEELAIDNYMDRLSQWESLDDEAKWDQQEPVMPEVVAYYEERGELWLDQEQEEDDAAPDVMSFSSDILG